MATRGDLESTAEFIIGWEGLELAPYHDSAGYPTIGVGHKLSDEVKADLSRWKPITREAAIDLLNQDLVRFRQTVNRVVYRVPSAAAQQDRETALISLAFNIGTGAFARSTLVDMINDGGSVPQWKVVLEWLDWCKHTVNGRKVVSTGLLNRRRGEVERYYGGAI